MTSCHWLISTQAQESDLLMHGPPIPPPALKFLAPSAMPHDTPQKRRLLALSVFEALVRVSEIAFQAH